MWKKTGAWFFKGLPRYELPPRAPTSRSSMRELRSQPERKPKLRMSVNDSSSDDDEDDVDCIDGTRMMSASRRSLPDKPFESNFFRRIESLRMNSRSPHSNHMSDGGESNGPRRSSPCSGSSFNRQYVHDSVSRKSAGNHATAEWDTESITSSRRDNNSLLRCSSVSSSCSNTDSYAARFALMHFTSDTNHINREPPLGWLEVSLLYTEADHVLDCSLLRARDLPAMDVSLLADPYCKLNIITDDGNIKQRKWLQTRTNYKTRNPVFNETIRFFGVEPDELRTSTLFIVLLDEDKYGSDFLGVGKFHLSTVRK